MLVAKAFLRLVFLYVFYCFINSKFRMKNMAGKDLDFED